MERPCRFCVAAFQCDDFMCEATHRDRPGLVELATAMACVFQAKKPSDEQVGYFMQDADAVVDDFDPMPEKWRIRRLPNNDHDGFDLRFRINDVTYVVPSGEGCIQPVRLSTYRQWTAEAEAEASR